MDNTEQNFLEALANIHWSPPHEEFRAYYREDGWVEFLTGSGFPDVGHYIRITKDEYINNPTWANLKVVNGHLVKVDIRPRFRVQLHKSNTGFRVVKGHASLLLDPEETYDTVEYYAKRNH